MGGYEEACREGVLLSELLVLRAQAVFVCSFYVLLLHYLSNLL